MVQIHTCNATHFLAPSCCVILREMYIDLKMYLWSGAVVWLEPWLNLYQPASVLHNEICGEAAGQSANITWKDDCPQVGHLPSPSSLFPQVQKEANR